MSVRIPFCVFDLLAMACLFRNREKIVEPLGVFSRHVMGYGANHTYVMYFLELF